MSRDEVPGNSDSITIEGVPFTFADIHTVVEEFYTQIPFDSQLEVPFRSVHDWPEHISRLTHFWWIRLGGTPYLFAQYNPVPKHFFAGFNDELLARWLSLFRTTLERNLTSEQCLLWSEIAGSMGQSLSARNESYRRIYESKQD